VLLSRGPRHFQQRELCSMEDSIFARAKHKVRARHTADPRLFLAQTRRRNIRAKRTTSPFRTLPRGCTPEVQTERLVMGKITLALNSRLSRPAPLPTADRKVFTSFTRGSMRNKRHDRYCRFKVGNVVLRGAALAAAPLRLTIKSPGSSVGLAPPYQRPIPNALIRSQLGRIRMAYNGVPTLGIT